MKRLITPQRWIGNLSLCLATCASILATADNTASTPQEQLEVLFSYRKQQKNKNKISNLGQDLVSQIAALLGKEYNEDKNKTKKLLKGALANTDSTDMDVDIFHCLQWAYQKGTSRNIVDKPQGNQDKVIAAMVAVLSAWRKKNVNIIAQNKSIIFERMALMIGKTAPIEKQMVKQALGYKPNDKDVIFGKALRWAYEQGVPVTIPVPDDNEDKNSIDTLDDGYMPTPEQPLNEQRLTPVDNDISNEATQTPPPNSSAWVYVCFGGGLVAIIVYQVYQPMGPASKAPKPRRRNVRQKEVSTA